MATANDIEKLIGNLCTPLGVGYAVQSVRPTNELDALAEEAERNLSGTETEWFVTLRSNKRRAEYCAGRIAVKRLLSQPPFQLCVSSFEVARASNGAPYLRRRDDTNGRHVPSFVEPHISITHSAEFAVAVASSFPIGIDLEQEEPRPDSFVRHFLADGEQAHVGSLAVEQRAAAINRFWSRKEAVSKVHGWGSSLIFRDLDCTRDWVLVGESKIRCVSAAREGFVASLACGSSTGSAGHCPGFVEQGLRQVPPISTTDSLNHG